MKSVFDMVAEVVGAAILKSFVGYLESVIETTISTIWKLVEISAMTEFCNEASEYLKRKDASNSIHRDPAAFAAWIKAPFERVPMLPCLAIKSRLCGDYTTMASLVDDAGNVVGSKQFANTRAYFDLLIKNADSYLKNNDLFVKGRGDDGMFVEAILKDSGTKVLSTKPAYRETYWEAMKNGNLALRMGRVGEYQYPFARPK